MINGNEPSARVLVVDDDPDVRDIVERCLVDAGYKVWTCGEGGTVLDLIQEHNINLAIVDLMLPDTDGLTLTRSLKEHSTIGVIILSGRGDTTEKIIGLEIGADDYLAKPFEPRELLARVRSVLRRLVQPSPTASSVETSAFSFEGWNLD
ncbi:MAG: response regulator, partial [Alphaproteobacteria bacterium]|nr:response regulator [Alphaproteobacteria bacterium]